MLVKMPSPLTKATVKVESPGSRPKTETYMSPGLTGVTVPRGLVRATESTAKPSSLEIRTTEPALMKMTA